MELMPLQPYPSPRRCLSRARRAWPHRAVMALLAIPVVLVLAAPARAAISSLDNWEKTFRSELVVRATVLDGDDRLARMKVDEVLKGDYKGEQLKIVFRAANFARKTWEEKITFKTGQHLILFLDRFRKNGVLQAPDQFELFRGSNGREEIPSEGEDAYLLAIRKFIEIQGLESQLARWDASRALLSETNPFLVDAGFEQVLKFRLANATLVPVLLGHLDSETVAFRQKAVRCFGQVFESTSREAGDLPTEDHIRDLLLNKAMKDPVADVRVESIKALGAWQDHDLAASFRAIAAQDPSQAVRYEAERAIYELESSSANDR
jgi:hypothetical protein